jgi:hypothetical protein
VLVVDYKPLLAQLNTERDRLDRAISLLQTLEQEQSSEFIISSQPPKRGRPLGSRNKAKGSTNDLAQGFTGELHDSAVSSVALKAAQSNT